MTKPIHVLCISRKAHASAGLGIGPCNGINTTLALNGSLEAKTRTVSSTSTLLTTDFAILASMAIILTLSAASTQNEMIIFVKNTSTSAVTVDPGSGDTIKGVASKSLSTHVILKQLFSQFFISIWFASILILGKASIF